MCACMFGRARAQMLLELESDRASLPALLQDIRARSNLSVKAFLAPGLEGGGVRVDSAESLHDFIARKTAPAPVPGVSAACVPCARRRRGAANVSCSRVLGERSSAWRFDAGRPCCFFVQGCAPSGKQSSHRTGDHGWRSS